MLQKCCNVTQLKRVKSLQLFSFLLVFAVVGYVAVFNFDDVEFTKIYRCARLPYSWLRLLSLIYYYFYSCFRFDQSVQKQLRVSVNVDDLHLSPKCHKLIERDPDAIKNAMNSNQAGVFKRSDFSIFNQSLNCDNFKRENEFTLEPHSQEEADFPLAFSILIYKDVEQFVRLLRAVYRPQNFYCIHVDAKSPTNVSMAVESIVSCFDNVSMASQSVRVIWGHISVLEPEMVCMRDLLKRPNWRFL